MADLALQSQHCWLACDIFCVKRRIAWNKLILKRDNNHFLLQLYILLSSPELGLLQAGPSYSTSAEPLADLRPGVGSQSVFLPSNKSLNSFWDIVTVYTFGAGKENRFPFDVNWRLVLMWTYQGFYCEWIYQGKALRLEMWKPAAFPRCLLLLKLFSGSCSRI